MCKEITDNAFKSEVLESDVPVIVDFFLPHCSPCKSVDKILQDLDEKLDGSIKVLKINIDDSPSIGQQYSIFSVPTVIGFDKGRITNQMTGIRQAEDYMSLVPHSVAA